MTKVLQTLWLVISVSVVSACSPSAQPPSILASDYPAFTNWLAYVSASAHTQVAGENAMRVAPLAEALLILDSEALTEQLAADFVQHNPMLEDGRNGLLALTLEGGAPRGGGDNLMAGTAHILAEDNRVVLHRLGQLGPLQSANFDVLEFDASGRLREHWAFLQPIEAGLIDNLLFSFVVPRQLDLIPTREIEGPGLTGDLPEYAFPYSAQKAETEANKARVLAYLALLHTTQEREQLSSFLAEAFFLHQPGVTPGREAWLDILEKARRRPQAPTVEMVVAQNDLVWVLSRVPNIRELDVPELAAVDLFRVREGLIVEQWKVIQPSPRFSRNGNGLF
jgi:predicted SnoaL-like aldol condensation-catalyzing enzyme